MAARMEQHTLRVPGWPDPDVQSKTLTLALRLVRTYGDRVPSYKRIMHDFDVSRATAYRWRAALLAAQQELPGPADGLRPKIDVSDIKFPDERWLTRWASREIVSPRSGTARPPPQRNRDSEEEHHGVHRLD